MWNGPSFLQGQLRSFECRTARLTNWHWDPRVYGRGFGRGRLSSAMFWGLNCAVGAAEASCFRGRSSEPKAAETYLGSCGPVVVLTASGGKGSF
jgi:hypothetical protein